MIFLQIGSFFMINLCLVVIATQFSETKKRETAKMRAERRAEATSSMGSLSRQSRFFLRGWYTRFLRLCTFSCLVLEDLKSRFGNLVLFSQFTLCRHEANLYRDIVNVIKFFIKRNYRRTVKFLKVWIATTKALCKCLI